MRWMAAITACVVGACTATPLEPGASRVRLTNSEPQPPCQYLGEVTGRQGGWWTGGWTTNADLDEGARNDMKNKAAAMGGNVAQIVANQSGISKAGDAGAQTTVVTYVASVFRCPS